jgi:hypothetical protein
VECGTENKESYWILVIEFHTRQCDWNQNRDLFSFLRSAFRVPNSAFVSACAAANAPADRAEPAA